MIDLKALPRDHPLRNRPLREIQAEQKCSVRWIKIDDFRIRNNFYNDLGPAWTETAEWRCPEPLSF